jgi:hypothetical protein
MEIKKRELIVPLECSVWVRLIKGFKVSEEEEERIIDETTGNTFYRFKLERVI